MSPPPSRIQRVQHVGLKVHDIEVAIAFYRDVLGFRVSDRYNPGDNPYGPHAICFMRCGNLHHAVSLVHFSKETEISSRPEMMLSPEVGLPHVAFEVGSKKELEDWANYIRAQGLELAMEPVVHSPANPEGDGTMGENRAFYFKDPSGNGIEIFCDMAEMDEDTNRVNDKWFRDRLERDGHAGEAADPPPAWKPGVSSMADAKERFGKK